MPRVDMDQVNSVSRDEAARVCFEALSAIQNDAPSVQVMAAGLLFVALCSKLGVDPQDLHHKASRVIRHAPHHVKANSQLEALQEYAGLQLATPSEKEPKYGR